MDCNIEGRYCETIDRELVVALRKIPKEDDIIHL